MLLTFLLKLLTFLLKNVKKTLSIKFKDSKFVGKTTKIAIFIYVATFLLKNVKESLPFLLKNVKKTLSIKFKDYKFVGKTTKWAIFFYATTFLICNIIAMYFGHKNYIPFLNIISHLGVNDFNPLTDIFDFLNITTGLSLMPFSFYLLHIINTQVEENQIIKNYKTMRICGYVAFCSSLTTNIGFIGVGIFSLDRNILGIHDYSAAMILLGLTFLAFSMGLLILRYQVKIPSLFGIFGMLSSFILLFVYLALKNINFQFSPIYEWIWLLSVNFWSWIFIFYIFNKSNIFINHNIIHSFITERKFNRKKKFEFEFN